MRYFSPYILPILLLQLIHLVLAGQNGLTIELIHRDSTESPLYPGNLTREERVSRFNQQSKTHVKRIMSLMEAGNNTKINYPNEVRATVSFEGSFYLVLVGIGKFNQVPSYKTYYLMVDTGSFYIWTQCEGCQPCYPQYKPVYPYTQSLTYNPLPCHEHEFCGEPGHCIANICTYVAQYGSGAVSHGILATETFTFKSDTQARETVDNLIIGCGFDQTNFDFGHDDSSQNQIAGFLGMGNTPVLSFIAQLGIRAQNKFSHCLQPWKNGRVSNTFLRFGNDAYFRSSERVFTIGLYRNGAYPYYYVNLVDITIAGTRLNFPTGTFSIRADGTGGCFVDNGSPWTIMSRKQYDRVTSVLVAFFRGLRKRQYNGFEHCYKKRSIGLNLPSMILHFLGADYEVLPEELFVDFEDQFCLAIMVQEGEVFPMLIGNHMQTNYRFIYDLTSMRLSFAREDCNNNQ